MIRKPLLTDRTVDGAEVITDTPHGPVQNCRAGTQWLPGLEPGLDEKENLLRGEGNWGCIPSSSHSALQYIVVLGFPAWRFSSNMLFKNIVLVIIVLLKDLG